MTTNASETSRTLQAVRTAFWVCLAVTIGCGDGSSAKPAASGDAGETVDEICQVAAELLGVDRSKINSETSLGELGADELDLVELVMHLEEHFGVSIPDESLQQAMGAGNFQQGAKNITISELASIVDGQMRTREGTQSESMYKPRARN